MGKASPSPGGEGRGEGEPSLASKVRRRRSSAQFISLLAAVLLSLIPATSAQPGEPAKPAGPILYQNDFEKGDLNQLPSDFLVLDGQFAVKEEKGNRFLELPGTPLETFGLLFGPAETSGVRLDARMRSSGRGRRQPSFTISLGGVNGFKLTVSPGKNALELFKSDEPKAAVPFAWNSGAWTRMALQITHPQASLWKIEGKAWPEGKPEPAWLLSAEESVEPSPGRAGIWGTPYSGEPIRFDDLQISRAPR